MSTAESKEIVRRYYEAGGRDDLDAWDALCDPDMVLIAGGFPAPVQGLATIKHFTAGMHQAITPYQLPIYELIAEGDVVAARWGIAGTHTGPLMSPAGLVPPTGRPVSATGMSFCRVANGKIVEERVELDIVSMMAQLGLLPLPAGAGA